MFEIRGVLEGFYGRPWSWAERRAMVDFAARHGYNRYFYAPKNDPIHRNRWREPYLPAEMRWFGELARQCEAGGLRLVFGLSPLEYRYSGEAHWRSLLDKVHAAQAVGIRDFFLLMDDMPDRFRYPEDGERFGSLGEAQAWLCGRLRQEVAGELYFCPTEYHGAGDSPYLRTLGERLDGGVEVFWTGREVCSSVLRTPDAHAVSAVLRRPVVYWDNYPVNDVDMRYDPHIRPYRGRDPDLDSACKGIALNAALQAEASKIALHTAAQYLADPQAYDPDAAWDRALLEVTGDPADAEAVRTLADLARKNPLEPGRHLDNALRGRLEGFFAAPVTPERVGEMRRLFEGLARSAERLEKLHNRALAADLAPWTHKLAGWAEVGLRGLDVLEAPSEAKVEELLGAIFRVRENFHWVGGDLFDVFARGCARAALEPSLSQAGGGWLEWK
ncbi:O-GlcNAcase NagJ [Calidithermus terrae]|uniref:O-GlcNAcase NagJ n=1 Tax=Calidithermus terrae TaxID=1408545 RepID=A0A399ELC9_9DEIN|nr:protein O-GlcNAcase [Calidithermus terrae]RIH85534.1 O-GlcNAcase NagJ [Calidithermus terrae]